MSNVEEKHVKATLDAIVEMTQAVKKAIAKGAMKPGGVDMSTDPDGATLQAAGLAVGRKASQGGDACRCS